MLHRALFGSLERFTGILIEHHAGAFPLWLAPFQVVVTTITSEADDYAIEVGEKLRKAGLRAEVDVRNEKIGYKIREHSVNKVPAIFAVGAREVAEGNVAVRRFGSKQQSVQSLADAITTLLNEARPASEISAQEAAE